MKIVNGQGIPDTHALPELEMMMRSADMEMFVMACEALRQLHTQNAYDVLKKYISCADLYKKRYVLSVIFDFDGATELISELENALQSDEQFLITTALDHIIQGKAHIGDEQLFTCLEKNSDKLNAYYYRVLVCVDKTKENLERILELYHTSTDSSIKTAIAECLYTFCNADNNLRLFHLFENSTNPQIRIIACQITKDYAQSDLLEKFKQDPNGHIRKLALSK